MGIGKYAKERIGYSVIMTGMIATTLGAIQSDSRSTAFDKKLNELGDKLSTSQIAEITELKNKIISGGETTIIGEVLIAGTIGCWAGQGASNRRKKNQEPSR